MGKRRLKPPSWERRHARNQLLWEAGEPKTALKTDRAATSNRSSLGRTSAGSTVRTSKSKARHKERCKITKAAWITYSSACELIMMTSCSAKTTAAAVRFSVGEEWAAAGSPQKTVWKSKCRAAESNKRKGGRQREAWQGQRRGAGPPELTLGRVELQAADCQSGNDVAPNVGQLD